MTRIFFICLLLLAPLSAFAQTSERGEVTRGPSGLQLPRFVSLSSDQANLRTGPGERYPILWIYVRADLPLEITAEFENWRRIRDVDGTTGWIHSALLAGKRTALISGQIRTFYDQPSYTAKPVLRAEPGVLAEINECDGSWCRVEIRGREGWINAEHFWGSYRGQILD